MIGINIDSGLINSNFIFELMTSQGLTAEEKTRFSDYFRQLIFQEAASKEMLEAFNSIPNVRTLS